MVPPSADATSGTYLQHQLVRIYLLVGEREGPRPARAVAQDPVLPLAQLAQDRYHLRPAPGQPALRAGGGRELGQLSPAVRTNAPSPRQATAQAAGQPDLVVDCSADLP